ncbi:glycogen recognition AMP-activated protein kinase [Nitzschia inconspicua]|uniref:Glycogen recognition AMP-activated protein kinase n=1 Tax=Nitzschia inconspicua TaxID=303405 RepID=A0A9K3L065_9STRA|nr:glycogen recognition AMP-activated protein kinase [Nitzschia inconspicua]KAG7353087.1 glycogen recognition AMP-activated protein kinase [Nitzschia inconspicua]
MGNQPSNGVPGGPPPPGGAGDPRGHGVIPPSTYGGYSGAGYPAGGIPGGDGYGVSGDGQQQQQQQQQQQPMQRTQSDASMTLLDADKTAAVVAGSPPAVENWLDDDTVPTVFRWEHGGRQVYITGTFNGWSRQIPMHRSGNDFTYIHNLKRGKHAFKFIVDDEWRFAPDQPTVADIEGRINNFIDVTDFKAYTGDREFEKEKAAAEYGYLGDEIPPSADITSGDESDDDTDLANRPDRDGEVFSQTMPDMDEYTKEPPPLPPHLRHIILNKPPQLQDTAALPVPQHVALNHLYCTAIKDNMMVLGITQRYKTKFVTTVYYSPCK